MRLDWCIRINGSTDNIVKVSLNFVSNATSFKQCEELGEPGRETLQLVPGVHEYMIQIVVVPEPLVLKHLRIILFKE